MRRPVCPRSPARGPCWKADVGRRPVRAATDRVRSAVEMVVEPHAGLERIYRRFGPVSTLGVGPFKYVYLLGPDANQFVIGHSELFGWREAFDPLAVVDGQAALIVNDSADHQRRRRLVTPAFHRRQSRRGRQRPDRRRDRRPGDQPHRRGLRDDQRSDGQGGARRADRPHCLGGRPARASSGEGTGAMSTGWCRRRCGCIHPR